MLECQRDGMAIAGLCPLCDDRAYDVAAEVVRGRKRHCATSVRTRRAIPDYRHGDLEHASATVRFKPHDAPSRTSEERRKPYADTRQ